MNNERYTAAGWLAMAGAAMTPPAVVISLLLDLGGVARPALIPVLVVLNCVGGVFSLYAFYRFKHLLNHRYSFHDVDGLIILLMIGSALMVIIATGGRMFSFLGTAAQVTGLAALMAVGIPLAVLAMVFAIRLLRLGADLHGLLKPYVYVQIATSICMMTVILAPVAHLLGAAAGALLGSIFFREDREESELEFV